MNPHVGDIQRAHGPQLHLRIDVLIDVLLLKTPEISASNLIVTRFIVPVFLPDLAVLNDVHVIVVLP